MFKLRRVYYYLGVVPILWGCFQPRDSSISDKLSLRLSDSVAIPVDSVTNVQGYIQLVSYQEEEWLVAYQYSKGYNDYYFYSLGSKQLERVVRVSAEGPNGVGKVAPVIAFNSFDSIFLFQVNTNIVFHIDSSGTVLKYYDLRNVESGNIHASPAFPPILKNGKLKFFRINTENNLFSKDFLRNSKAEGEYDLITGTYQNNKPSYPSYPDGYELSIESWKVSRCVGLRNEQVYSFAFDNRLWVIDGNKSFIVNVENPHRPAPTSANLSNEMNMVMHLKFISERGLYTYLLTDPYQRFYYRIFLLPCDYLNPDGSLKKISDYPWLLEIFDEQFRLYGRAYFPERKYNPYGLLVSKAGILVPPGVGSQRIDEDTLKYDVFTVTEMH